MQIIKFFNFIRTWLQQTLRFHPNHSALSLNLVLRLKKGYMFLVACNVMSQSVTVMIYRGICSIDELSFLRYLYIYFLYFIILFGTGPRHCHGILGQGPDKTCVKIYLKIPWGMLSLLISLWISNENIQTNVIYYI